MTVYFDSWPATLAQKTVHYRPGPFTLDQMTVQFGSKPSTFTLLDRPLWTRLKNIPKHDLKSVTKSFISFQKKPLRHPIFRGGPAPPKFSNFEFSFLPFLILTLEVTNVRIWANSARKKSYLDMFFWVTCVLSVGRYRRKLVTDIDQLVYGKTPSKSRIFQNWRFLRILHGIWLDGVFFLPIIFIHTRIISVLKF